MLMADGSFRLFIALLPPPEVLAAAAEVQAALHAKQLAVRWARPEGIHVTLQFLGETRSERAPALASTLARVAAVAGPLTLTTAGVGHFPAATARPRVVWLGLTGAVERLAALQAAVVQATSLLGWEPEARPFAPHLTLGRVRPDATDGERAHIGKMLRATPAPAPAVWRVEEIVLMRSILDRAGATYQPVNRWRLGNGEPAEASGLRR